MIPTASGPRSGIPVSIGKYPGMRVTTLDGRWRGQIDDVNTHPNAAECYHRIQWCKNIRIQDKSRILPEIVDGWALIHGDNHYRDGSIIAITHRMNKTGDQKIMIPIADPRFTELWGLRRDPQRIWELMGGNKLEHLDESKPMRIHRLVEDRDSWNNATTDKWVKDRLNDSSFQWFRIGKYAIHRRIIEEEIRCGAEIYFANMNNNAIILLAASDIDDDVMGRDDWNYNGILWSREILREVEIDRGRIIVNPDFMEALQLIGEPDALWEKFGCGEVTFS